MGKFRADQMLFVGMAGQKPQLGWNPPPPPPPDKIRFKNIDSFAFSFETNLIQKYVRSYQTVIEINASRVLQLTQIYTHFLRIETQLSLPK